MARPTLEKAKQQAADLKAGMTFDQWLKKWGFSKQGAWAKTSRLKKIGLLPPDYTTSSKAAPKIPKGTKGPKRPQRPIGPIRPSGPQRPEGPHGKPKRLTLSKIRLLLPADLIKKLKIKAIVEDKTLSTLITELVIKGLK